MTQRKHPIGGGYHPPDYELSLFSGKVSNIASLPCFVKHTRISLIKYQGVYILPSLDSNQELRYTAMKVFE